MAELRSALRSRAHYLRSLIRRWSDRVHLLPLKDLHYLGQGHWRSIGNDPQFLCSGLGYPLPQGWYEISLRLRMQSLIPTDPQLYVDYGHGMQEAWALRLHFFSPQRTNHRGVVVLEHGATCLRLDPMSCHGSFEFSNLRIRRVSRIRAAWRMLLGTLLRDQPVAERWSLVKDVAGTLGRGAASVGALLRHRYEGLPRALVGYTRWLQLYDRPAAVPDDGGGEAFSILLPVFNTPERWLRRCLDSVLAQRHTRWELCVVDDASTEPQVRRVLEEYRQRDQRIKVEYRPRNGHISAASNSALAMASNDFVVLLDHDDELHPDALLLVARGLRENPQWRMVYSDEDKIDENGQRSDPYFKPDWNRELLLGHNSVSHMGVYARALLKDVGGFREGFEGSQDWDLALRCIEQLNDDEIGHVPKVLYHWRTIAGSTALGVGQKGYAHEAGRRAVSEHLQRQRITAEVNDIGALQGMFRVRHALPAPAPRVSIVIPTRDRVELLRQCITSILERSSYPDYEILVVDNQSAEPQAVAYLESLRRHSRVRVLQHDEPFNYSRINNRAVAQCSGEVVALLNNDIEVISPDWLEEMVSHVMKENVGAVGAMLYYPDNTIQHAGVILGMHGVAGHPYSRMPRHYGGQMGRARLTQQLAAVTAACLVIRKVVYQKVGGLDEGLAVAFNDIDFCLRLDQQGYRNLWTPFAELYHHESASRGSDDTPEKQRRFEQEVDFMFRRWGAILQQDRFYNPNLSLSGEPFSLAFPPRG